MTIWDTVQREITGTARSLGYDVRRRFRALTSRSDSAYPEYAAYMRRPRRALLGGGIAALAVIGVVGTYLALAGGLGGWLLGSNISAPNPAGPGGAPAVTGAAHAPHAHPFPSPSPTAVPTTPRTGGGRGNGRAATGVDGGPADHRATSSPTPSATGKPTRPAPAPSPTPDPPATPTDPPTSGDPTPPDSPAPSATGPAPDGAGAVPRNIAGNERSEWSSSTIATAGA